MTLKELQEKWAAACGKHGLEGSSSELRMQSGDGFWMARGGGSRMAGADLESAVRGLLALVESGK